MAQKSKALILGIDAYESVSPLRGCVNDTRDIADLLIGTFGFPAESVKVLTDRDVRRARVRPLLTWLFEDMGDGDRAVLHFSGHGSQVADEEGEEADGLDEILCLQDMSFDRPSSFLLDDELARWTKRCPRGVRLNVFLDCCHSGTGTRKLIPPLKTEPSIRYPRIIESTTARRAAERQAARRGRVPGAPSLELSPTLESLTTLARSLADPPPEVQVLARFVDPPPEVQQRIRRRLEGRPRSDAGPIEVVPGMNHLLLAACQDYQTAADAHIDGEFRGAFSCHLGRILRDAGRDLDRGELIVRLERALRDNHFEQIPRLEASHPHGPLLSPGTDQGAQSGATEPASPVPDAQAPLPEPAPPAPDDLLPGEADSPDWPPKALAASLPEDGSELYRELIATFNRLLDLIQPGIPSAALASRAGQRQIVYVHGIGRHPVGYSNSWWSALSPYTPSLRPGTLGGNRHEVNWSDLVNRGLDPGARVRSELDTDAERFARQVREELQDRADLLVEGHRALAEARGESLAADDRAAVARDLERGLLGGLDDFARYMTSDSVRRAVLARFHDVVRPLLRGGASVVLITHSWGTVVAFEGLRQLDSDRSIPPGSVHAFFTVGSALSIPAVRWNLAGRVPDGRKPASVARWINVDASGDLVGGPVQSKGFAVDVERLGLPAVGCGPLNAVCAHSSYFDPRNIAVNRDLFAAYIETT